MTVATLRPSGTTINTGALTGGATAHAVLSDNSDASYVELELDENTTVTMTDLTLPAGAVIRNAVARIRNRVVGGGGVVSTQFGMFALGGPNVLTTTTTTWVTPTTISGATSFGWTDAFADGASMRIIHGGPNAAAWIYVYEAYLDIVYVIVPVVTVVTPTGTSTSNNQPTVTWSNVLDSDGSGQFAWEVKVFSAAQYGAGGFNPDSSTPTAQSGIIQGFETAPPGTAQSYKVASVLANATYRAYVRVAQQVNSALHWSAWDFEGFVINVTPPSVPTLTLTAQSTSGRIKVDVNDNAGATATQALEIQRTIDGGTTWLPVRNAQGSDGFFVGTDATIYDYEVPNGTTAGYRARALFNYPGTDYSASAWTSTSSTSWSGTDCWLKHPNQPSLNLKLTNMVQSYVGHQDAARIGVFMPLGASLPVVVSDTRGGETGTIVLALTSAVNRAKLDALIASVGTLLLQAPASTEPDRYIRIGDHSRERVGDKSFVLSTNETLPWVQVGSPPGEITGAEWS